MALAFLALDFFHVVFTAWGLGGATIAAILMAKAEKEPALAAYAMRFMEPISKLIWIALIGLAITGIFSTVMGAGKGYFDQNLLLVKHVAVALLFINGLNITFNLLPKMKKFSPKPNEKPSHSFLKNKKILQLSSIASLVLWYAVVALSIML